MIIPDERREVMRGLAAGNQIMQTVLYPKKTSAMR
jgi:hypothetical protein